MFQADGNQERPEGLLFDARITILLRQTRILKVVASVLAAIATLVRVLLGG
jgi:hypothetical protein